MKALSDVATSNYSRQAPPAAQPLQVHVGVATEQVAQMGH